MPFLVIHQFDERFMEPTQSLLFSIFQFFPRLHLQFYIKVINESLLALAGSFFRSVGRSSGAR